jgi:hypothetical protein
LKVWAAKRGARRAGLLPPHLLAIEFEDRLGVVAQKRDFLLAKAVRKEQIALLIEIAELVG